MFAEYTKSVWDGVIGQPRAVEQLTRAVELLRLIDVLEKDVIDVLANKRGDECDECRSSSTWDCATA